MGYFKFVYIFVNNNSCKNVTSLQHFPEPSDFLLFLLDLELVPVPLLCELQFHELGHLLDHLFPVLQNLLLDFVLYLKYLVVYPLELPLNKLPLGPADNNLLHVQLFNCLVHADLRDGVLQVLHGLAELPQPRGRLRVVPNLLRQQAQVQSLLVLVEALGHRVQVQDQADAAGKLEALLDLLRLQKRPQTHRQLRGPEAHRVLIAIRQPLQVPDRLVQHQ